MKRNKIHEQAESSPISLMPWHRPSGSSIIESTSEFDAHMLCFQSRPIRIKIEVLRIMPGHVKKWDFANSLWDSYETVNVSKKLERCLSNRLSVFGVEQGGEAGSGQEAGREQEQPEEFVKMASERFSEVDSS